MKRWSVAVLCLVSACVHSPPSRPVEGGETFTFDAIEVRAPAGGQWQAEDWVVGMQRQLTLVSTGTTLRKIWVEEQAIGERPTPEEFREAFEKTVETFAPGAVLVPPAPGQDPVAIERRFGPLSSCMSFRVDRLGDPAGGAAARYVRYGIVPPEPPHRAYLLQYSEESAGGDPPPGIAEGFEARAAAFFEGVRLTRPPGGSRVALAAADRDRPHQSFALGPGAWRLRGVTFAGAGMRLAGGYTLLVGSPGGRTRFGGELQLNVNAGADATGERSSVVGTVSLLALVAHGSFRAGGGLDLGAAALDRLDERETVGGLVLGPRAFASVDLFTVKSSTIFLAVDGLAATPSLFQATALLGFR